MKNIRIHFTDFWRNFDPENNFIYKTLEKNYNIVISDDPDFLFFSCQGFSHLDYECVKIFYTGENLVPDFNFCDYAIGFHYLDFGERYLRVPLFSIRHNYKGLLETSEIENKRDFLDRKFCNFLYSNKNNAHPIRKKFFERLNEYKKVDSGGKYLNNMNHQVNNKLSFLSEYKFTIAFENSACEGYTTEKLVDPMSVSSVPIYWGNPLVGKDFNTASFISLKNSSDKEIENTIKKIIELDRDDDQYLSLLKQPWLFPNQYINAEKNIENFLNVIFSSSRFDNIKRPKYGRNRFQKNIYKNMVQNSSQNFFCRMINKLSREFRRSKKL